MPIRMLVLVLIGAAMLLSSKALAHPAGESAPQPPHDAAKAEEGKLFALLLRPGPAWKPGRPFTEQGLRPHFDYWMGLFKAGRIATAGPLGDDGGLVLLLARDQQEAGAIMRADPAITSGIFAGDVRPYAPPMINKEVLGE